MTTERQILYPEFGQSESFIMTLNMLNKGFISCFTAASQHANTGKASLPRSYFDTYRHYRLSFLFRFLLAVEICFLLLLLLLLVLEFVFAWIFFCFLFFFFRACEYDRSHHYRRCLSVSYCGAPPFSAHCHHPTSGLCEKSLKSSADQMPEWRRNTNSLHSLFRGILAKLCAQPARCRNTDSR